LVRVLPVDPSADLVGKDAATAAGVELPEKADNTICIGVILFVDTIERTCGNLGLYVWHCAGAFFCVEYERNQIDLQPKARLSE
jgi:hypothetical protein